MYTKALAVAGEELEVIDGLDAELDNIDEKLLQECDDFFAMGILPEDEETDIDSSNPFGIQDELVFDAPEELMELYFKS